MARITDQNKLERLKQSTMKLVVENGFGGASAVLIAKDAKVAAGYFYMHYHGKYEMVNSLLHSVYQEVMNKLEELLLRGCSFDDIVENLINYFFTIARTEPIKIKFLYVLTNDYRFVIDKKVVESAYVFIKKLKEMGNSTGMLDPRIAEDDLYLMLVINTIQYINQRYKNPRGKFDFNKNDENHLLYLIYKFLK